MALWITFAVPSFLSLAFHYFLDGDRQNFTADWIQWMVVIDCARSRRKRDCPLAVLKSAVATIAS